MPRSCGEPRYSANGWMTSMVHRPRLCILPSIWAIRNRASFQGVDGGIGVTKEEEFGIFEFLFRVDVRPRVTLFSLDVADGTKIIVVYFDCCLQVPFSPLTRRPPHERPQRDVPARQPRARLKRLSPRPWPSAHVAGPLGPAFRHRRTIPTPHSPATRHKGTELQHAHPPYRVDQHDGPQQHHSSPT